MKSFSDTIMPDEIIESAQLVADKMDGLAAAIKTSAMGFNFDGAIRQSVIGKRGIEFCRDLATSEVTRIAGSNDFALKHAITFEKGGLRYNVRIEPHVRSGGEDLFFAINGHQNVNLGECLLDKIERHTDFIRHAQGLLNRIENRGDS